MFVRWLKLGFKFENHSYFDFRKCLESNDWSENQGELQYCLQEKESKS